MVNGKYTNTWKIQLSSVSLYYKKCFESIISLRSYTQLSYSEGSVHEGGERHINRVLSGFQTGCGSDQWSHISWETDCQGMRLAGTESGTAWYFQKGQ